MIKKLIKKILEKFGVFMYISLIRNININPLNLTQPRILISYLCSLFELDVTKPIGRTHYFEINEMLKIFSERGYCIDLVNCNSCIQINKIKNIKYDIIFGFGEVFYQMSLLQPQAKTILYMTENHPIISEEEEVKRKDYYYMRHNKKVKFTRSGRFYTKIHLSKKYDHIITMSDLWPLQSQYNKIYSIFPTGLVNTNFVFAEKNHDLCKKKYLWMGSSGAIHKGLDLLVDIFSKKPDFHLYVCGLNSKDRAFLNYLAQNNIHDCGYVDIQSNMFLEIVNKCTYIILPSCSEACSTSVVTGMLHGLIPIVMRDAGFNKLENNALFFEDYQIDYMTKKIIEFSNYDNIYLSDLRENIYSWASSHFSLNAFRDTFANIIDSIIELNV